MKGNHATELSERVEAACAAGKAQRCRHGAASYVRFGDDAEKLKRGSVVLMGEGGPRLVSGYGSIARVVALEAGARAHARGALRVEEKIDGFNVRIVRWQGQLLAFTRGGWACPFTIDRLPDMAALHPLFDDDPDAVICAEVAGPGNPYMTAQARGYTDDVALFAFDAARLDGGEPEPLALRDALFSRHGVPQAPELVRLPDLEPPAKERLRSLALELDAQGAEGMIIKPEAGGLRIKYVTPAVNLADIRADAHLLAELPGGFFTSRILRLVIGVRELGARHRLVDFEATLGRALAAGLEASLDQLEREGVVYEDVGIRVRDPRTVDRLVAHLNRSSKTIKSHVVSRARDGDYTRAVVRKVMLRSTSYLKSLLRGDPIVD